jgi:hypothetical protein
VGTAPSLNGLFRVAVRTCRRPVGSSTQSPRLLALILWSTCEWDLLHCKQPTMGGTYTDHPDPRLRARTEMPSAPDNAGINVERPLLSVETNPTLPNDINKVEPVTPAAIPALDDDKKM